MSLGISEYERQELNGSWVYKTKDLKGTAKIKNGAGYYNKNGCNIVFDYTSKEAYTNKKAVYTDVSVSCKVGYYRDKSRNQPNDEKMGYVRISQ